MSEAKEPYVVSEQSGMQLGIIPARTPHDVIVQATAIAKELANIVKENHLANMIQNKNFVRVEGWSTMGAMIGILPREIPELGRRLDDGSYEAVVELIRISDGAVVGRASALVGMDEKDKTGKLTWGSRSEFARKSMAITRATGKAYRLGFSWIMALAGYEATPAEEMSDAIEGEFHDTPSANGNGKAKDNDPPSTDALLAWANLQDQAKALNIPIPSLSKKLTTAMLRNIYAEVRDQIKAKVTEAK